MCQNWSLSYAETTSATPSKAVEIRSQQLRPTSECIRLRSILSSSKSLLGGLSLICGRRNARSPRPVVVSAADASFESEGPPKKFPRINVRDPYKRLGLGRDASTEEITEAKNYLVEEYRGDERSREAIEDAFDRIIAEKFRERKKSKINLKVDLKKKAESNPFLKGFLDFFDVPKKEVILQRFILFLLLAAWSVFYPSEGGPAFQVAVALGLSVYFINERIKSIGRSIFLGFGALIVGWFAGSLIIPFIPASIFPTFWNLELGTALVAYFFLWIATTFFK